MTFNPQDQELIEDLTLEVNILSSEINKLTTILKTLQNGPMEKT